MSASDNFAATMIAFDAVFGKKVVRTVKRFQSLPEADQRRTVEHYLLVHKPNGKDWLCDIAMELDMEQVLDNFAAGDDLANGVLLKKLLLKVGDKINEDERYPL